jgi:hypothetical protein
MLTNHLIGHTGEGIGRPTLQTKNDDLDFDLIARPYEPTRPPKEEGFFDATEVQNLMNFANPYSNEKMTKLNTTIKSNGQYVDPKNK